MLRNQTFTSSVTSAMSAEITESFQQKLAGAPRLRTMEQLIGLPTSARGFVLVTLTTALVCAGMALLVFTSIQTFQTRQLIAQRQQQQQRIERQNANLIWQIAQYTALDKVRQRALDLGYEAPTARNFVVRQENVAPTPMADDAGVAPINPVGQHAAKPDMSQWFQQQIRPFISWWQK